MNENKILNKCISIESIIKVANYLEQQQKIYKELFEKDREKNKDLEWSEKKYEYEGENPVIKYTITLKDGKTLTETDKSWFLEQLEYSKLKEIKEIDLDLNIYYSSDVEDRKKIYKRLGIYIRIYEYTACIDIDSTNLESEANKIYSEIRNILEDNPDRYNKTINYRNLRIQSFCISVGIVLSYIIYLIYIINKSKIPATITQILDNKNVIVLGQWILAIAVGNIFGKFIIQSLYNTILPERKYVGYNSSNYKSIYKDDVDDYVANCEVHFGKYYNAQKNRDKIEKIYKITNKILLVQLVISIILFVLLK